MLMGFAQHARARRAVIASRRGRDAASGRVQNDAETRVAPPGDEVVLPQRGTDPSAQRSARILRRLAAPNGRPTFPSRRSGSGCRHCRGRGTCATRSSIASSASRPTRPLRWRGKGGHSRYFRHPRRTPRRRSPAPSAPESAAARTRSRITARRGPSHIAAHVTAGRQRQHVEPAQRGGPPFSAMRPARLQCLSQWPVSP